MRRRPRHRSFWRPVLSIVGVIALSSYSVIALMSQDPLWFLGWTSVPDPARVVVRAGDEDAILPVDSPEYDLTVAAVRKALSSFTNLAPLSAGLSEETRAEYRRRGAVLELTFDEPVDFHLPFDDGRPTALLILVDATDGQGYVFRGRSGAWWSGQMCVRDPQPLLETLIAQGYIQP